VAPATNRPEDTYFSDAIDPVISRMAERSYEVYCNIVDAMDELDIVIASGSLQLICYQPGAPATGQPSPSPSLALRADNKSAAMNH